MQRHKMLKHKLCKMVLQLKCNHCACIFSDQDAFEQHVQETESYLKTFLAQQQQPKQQQQQPGQQQQQLDPKEEEENETDQENDDDEDEDKGHYKCPQCDFVGTLAKIQSHLKHCNN